VIGAHDDGGDLRTQPLDHVLGHGDSRERDETFVDAAHANTLTAGEHDAGKLGFGDGSTTR
jgi:hypothetical protein